MKKNRGKAVEELTGLLKKTLQNAESVDKAEKKRMKKLISDPTLLLEAMQRIDPDCNGSPFPLGEDTRSLTEIVADDYIALAKFAIGKSKLQNVRKLKAEISDGGYILYALTPEPVELDFLQYATSDYPDIRERLLEAEALECAWIMEGGEGNFRLAILRRIEDAVL